MSVGAASLIQSTAAPAEPRRVCAMSLALRTTIRPRKSATRRAHVIVVGNQKGGAGKSTVAMHVIVVALMRMGRRTGVLDLDVRQRSLTRYIENRARWIASRGAPSWQSPQGLDTARKAPQRSLDVAEAGRGRRAFA
jgi:chromosome partitioning protein